MNRCEFIHNTPTIFISLLFIIIIILFFFLLPLVLLNTYIFYIVEKPQFLFIEINSSDLNNKFSIYFHLFLYLHLHIYILVIHYIYTYKIYFYPKSIHLLSLLIEQFLIINIYKLSMSKH